MFLRADFDLLKDYDVFYRVQSRKNQSLLKYVLPLKTPMVKNGLNAFKGQRVLLLQGPVGPFFNRLSRDLETVGAQTFKINFNGGDCLFYPTGAVSFTGGIEDWPAYLADFLITHQIDSIIVFGDCRPMHQIAHELAEGKGLRLGVFEEGYIRPDHVTFEFYGVNGHSTIPRDGAFYEQLNLEVSKPAQKVKHAFGYAALWSMCYYIAAFLLQWRFRKYEHHRPLNLFEGLYWVRAFYRKYKYKLKEKGIAEWLVGASNKSFYLVPLQVHNDAQIVSHSEYDTVAEFIRDVITSFAKFAKLSDVLVFKHHPLDRGYYDYDEYITTLAASFNIKRRIFYIHDQHLPSLLDAAKGVIVINSTVGLSALYHNAPVKVCGDAIYDIKGLTFNGCLDDFWQASIESTQINKKLYEAFYLYLVSTTQINGSFYSKLGNSYLNCGLILDINKTVE